MDGIHDLGGRQGYGPIDVNEPPEPFHAPWEARVLGIVRAFTRPAHWSIDWFRHVRECIEPADYLTRPYYDQWLQTYAAMMIDSGRRDYRGAVDRQVGAGDFRPSARRSRRRRSRPRGRRMTRFDRESNAVPAFAAGDAVITRSQGSRGHTRLPEYARGRPGRVESFRGFHVLPDTNMAGGGPAEPLYTVSFLAADLWPEAGGRKDRVYLDLWESYLGRA